MGEVPEIELFGLGPAAAPRHDGDVQEVSEDHRAEEAMLGECGPQILLLDLISLNIDYQVARHRDPKCSQICRI